MSSQQPRYSNCSLSQHRWPEERRRADVLGSLAPGKGFHNVVEPLFFCTLEGRGAGLAENGRAAYDRYEHSAG